MSATGTYLPSTWQNDWPNWRRAMSLMGGISYQPERVTAWRTSIAAPHAGQFWRCGSAAPPHHWHWYVCALMIVLVLVLVLVRPSRTRTRTMGLSPYDGGDT